MKTIALFIGSLALAASVLAGTPGRVPKFLGTSTIVNSLMSETGSTVTVHGNFESTGTVISPAFAAPTDSSSTFSAFGFDVFRMDYEYGFRILQNIALGIPGFEPDGVTPTGSYLMADDIRVSTPSALWQFGAGTADLPSVTSYSNGYTGLYFPDGEDLIGFTINSSTVGYFTPAGFHALGLTISPTGAGTAITEHLSATASLDFGATAAGTCDLLTITVTGAVDGDTVVLGVPAALSASDNYQAFTGYVSAADTVTVKRCNLLNAVTALSDPAAATVRADVWRH